MRGPARSQVLSGLRAGEEVLLAEAGAVDAVTGGDDSDKQAGATRPGDADPPGDAPAAGATPAVRR